ncbi:hypothetical protein ACLOJK_010901 [Asimina triloba]
MTSHPAFHGFLAGFFFAAVPWYIGAFILLFVGVDYREKAGLIACTIGVSADILVAAVRSPPVVLGSHNVLFAVLVAITVILGLSHENVEW